MRELAGSVWHHDPHKFQRALWWERFAPDEIPVEEAAALAHAKAFLIERNHPTERALALRLNEEAVKLDPSRPVYWSNLGRSRVWNGDFTGGVKAFLQAMTLPDCPHDVRAALGDALALSGDIAGAEAADAAVAAADLPEYVDPDVAHNCAFAALRARSWRRGWRWLQARKGSLHEGVVYTRRPFPTGCGLWDGSRTDRPVVILWEQGLGDTLMLLRWVAWAKRRAARVYVEVQPPLVRWCRDLGVTDVRAVTTDANGVRQYPDGWPADALVCWTFDLPWLADCRTPADVPLPYAPMVMPTPTGLPAEYVVLNLYGNPGHKNQHRRSLPADQWPVMADALRAAGVPALVSVNPDPTWRDALPAMGVQDASGGDFLDTAGILKHAAAVVTVDTAVAHAAGSLGVPTVVLLDICAEWRWGLSGTSTCWYDSVRLSRQATPGVWNAEDVTAYTNLIVSKRRGSSPGPVATRGRASCSS